MDHFQPGLRPGLRITAQIEAVGRAGRGHVQQPPVLGVVLAPVPAAQIAVPPRLAALLAQRPRNQRHGQAVRRPPAHRLVPFRRAHVRLRHKDDRELQPLGAVDGEYAHRVGLIDHRQTFPIGQLVAPPAQVCDHLVDRAAGQVARDRHQLADVGQRLLTAVHGRPRRLEAGERQRRLDDRVRRLDRRHAAQAAQHCGRMEAALPDVLVYAVRRIAQRLQPVLAGSVTAQQRSVVQHEQRRPQHAGQGYAVVRLGQPRQQVGEVAHLLAGEEAGAGRRSVRHAAALQRLFEDVHVGEPAEQDGDVAGSGAAAQHGGDLVRYRVRLHAPAVLFAGRRAVRRSLVDRDYDQVRSRPAGRPAAGHALHRRGARGRPVRTGLLGEQRREQRIAGGHQIVMGSERSRQGVQAAAGVLDLRPEADEVGDVAAAEPIDRLFGVADQKPVGPRLSAVGQQAQQGDLRLVDVLHLVDHDVPEPAAEAGGDRRMIAEQPDRLDLQVEIIAAAQRRLARLVAAAGVVEHGAQRIGHLQCGPIRVVPARRRLQPLRYLPHGPQVALYLVQVPPIALAARAQTDQRARGGQRLHQCPGLLRQRRAQSGQHVPDALRQRVAGSGGCVLFPYAGDRPLQVRPLFRDRGGERLVEQRPHAAFPVIDPGAGHGGAGHGGEGGLHFVAAFDHARQLLRDLVDAEFTQRPRASAAGLRRVLQGVQGGRHPFVLRLVVGQDAAGGDRPGLHRMLAQNLPAQRMQRADHRLVQVAAVAGQLRPLVHGAPHPVAHLGGGRVGKGDRGDLRNAALGQQGQVALDQHAGLAAAGAGGDQDVAAAVGDDGLLLRRQS